MIQPENEKMIISTTTCNLSAKSNILSAWLQLPQNFLIPNPHQIEHYLFHHTNMIAPTKDLCHAVYNKISPSFQLSLEFYQDYEEDFNCLTINLRSHNYPESTMQLIDHLVTDTADILKSAPEFIAIHTNFEPPI